MLNKGKQRPNIVLDYNNGICKKHLSPIWERGPAIESCCDVDGAGGKHFLLTAGEG